MLRRAAARGAEAVVALEATAPSPLALRALSGSLAALASAPPAAAGGRPRPGGRDDPASPYAPLAASGGLADSSNARADLRSSSGLGLGDGLVSHTAKWRSVAPGDASPGPMELVAAAPPIAWPPAAGDPAAAAAARPRGAGAVLARHQARPGVAVCTGGPDVHPDLGHEVEYIRVAGRTRDNPSRCKYCGLRYYENPDAPGGH